MKNWSAAKALSQDSPRAPVQHFEHDSPSLGTRAGENAREALDPSQVKEVAKSSGSGFKWRSIGAELSEMAVKQQES